MTEWFEEWFGEEYLELYPHRDDAEAERAVRSSPIGWDFSRGGGCWTSPVAPGATRAPSSWPGAVCGRRPFGRAAARRPRCDGAPLVRADMRGCRSGPRSMDLTVNLFTSFGYFDRDAEHAGTLARWPLPCGPADGS